MDPEVIVNLLARQRDEVPTELQHHFLKFEDYWERKLWHELTDELIEFFNLAESGPYRIALYNDFINTFADKINQLKLVTLCLATTAQFPDDDSRLAFLAKLVNRVQKPSSQDAYVYAKVAVANIRLQKRDHEGARKDLEQSEAILDTFDSVETAVHAAFYRVNSEYYKGKREFAEYYKNALLYLACIDINDLTLEERQVRAYELSIAALVSDSIYNFGELLLHPILDSLQGTPHSWLRDLLFAFNRGDLAAYNMLEGSIMKNDLLPEFKTFLHQKICLSALTEAVFRRPPQDRSMSFNLINQETKVQMNEIEHLIMKALSLGLLRGTMDQVGQVASITWVQPKVLDMKQIDNMRTRLKEWDTSVNQLGTWMEGEGRDVWAA